MEIALDKVTAERIPPKRGMVAICQCCEQDLIPKCGDIRIHHWAHKRNHCDRWWESETEWHRGWKRQFPADWRECIKTDTTTNEKHIADIYHPIKDLVIEFQNSAISQEELKSREGFYKKMIWVVNKYELSIELLPLETLLDDLTSSKDYFLSGQVNNAMKFSDEMSGYLIQYRNSIMTLKRKGSFKRELEVLSSIFNEQFDNVVLDYRLNGIRFDGPSPDKILKNLIAPVVLVAKNEIIGLIERNSQLDEKNRYYKYNWPRMGKIWGSAERDVFLDTGPELLWLLTDSIVKRVPKENFIAKYAVI